MTQRKNLLWKLSLPLTMFLLPVVLFAQNGIGHLRIAGAANLIVTGSIKLVLNDVNFINDGNFSAGTSEVIFTGTKTTVVGGTHFSGFKNFTPNKSSNNVRLDQSITVLGNLTMARGDVVVNNVDINLGSTGIINQESELASINSPTGGRILVTRVIPANVAVNPGNIGAEVLISGVTGSQTTLTIVRTFLPELLTTVTTQNSSINRAFTLSTSTNSPLNYSLRLFYLNDELNGNGADQLSMWLPNPGPGFSADLGADVVDLRDKSITKNLTQLGHFTLANHDPGGIIQPDGSIAARSTNMGEVASVRINAYPNPSHNIFNVEISSNVEKNIPLRLIDQYGRILQQKTIHCLVGKNLVPWDVSRYAAGVYFIMSENTGLKNIKIIKE